MAARTQAPRGTLTRRTEDDLFRALLLQTDLARECQDWMMQTLAARGRAEPPESAQRSGSGGVQVLPPAAG